MCFFYVLFEHIWTHNIQHWVHTVGFYTAKVRRGHNGRTGERGAPRNPAKSASGRTRVVRKVRPGLRIVRRLGEDRREESQKLGRRKGNIGTRRESWESIGPECKIKHITNIIARCARNTAGTRKYPYDRVEIKTCGFKKYPTRMHAEMFTDRYV